MDASLLGHPCMATKGEAARIRAGRVSHSFASPRLRVFAWVSYLSMALERTGIRNHAEARGRGDFFRSREDAETRRFFSSRRGAEIGKAQRGFAYKKSVRAVQAAGRIEASCSSKRPSIRPAAYSGRTGSGRPSFCSILHRTFQHPPTPPNLRAFAPPREPFTKPSRMRGKSVRLGIQPLRLLKLCVSA